MGFAEQARISEQHRAAQARLQALVAADTAKVFPLLDVNNVDKTFGTYFDSMRSVVNARRTISSSLGSTYYSAIRSDAGVAGVFTPILSTAVNEQQLFSSLLTTGPVAVKKALAAGVDPVTARNSALSATIKANQRHVINGSRETILNSVRRDDGSVGWARLTDGQPCAFCALLASRGPAYKSEGTSKFRAHDGCGCTAVPVFDPEAPWPGRAREFREAYDRNISGKFSGGDGNNPAVRAWRKYYGETELAGKAIVENVAETAANIVESSVGWQAAFQSAQARLPQDKLTIGRSGGRTLTAAEQRQLDAAVAAKTRVESLQREYRSSPGRERRVEIEQELSAIIGEPATDLIVYKTGNFVRSQNDIIKNFETVRRGKLDITDAKLPGEVMDEHLDAILQAGNALGSELDRRIAARIASGGDVASAATEAAALKTVEKKLADAIAKREAIKESLRAKAVDRVERGLAPYSGTVEEQIEKTLRNLLYFDKKARSLETTIRRLNNEQVRLVSLIKRLETGDLTKGPLYNQIVREETIKILEEVRSMGGAGAEYISGKTGKAIGKSELVDAMRKAEAAYPTAWLEALRARFPRIDLGKSARGYNRDGNIIRLSQHSSRNLPGDMGYDAVAIHELGHSMESVINGLSEMQWAYHTRRGAIRGADGKLKEPGKLERVGGGCRNDEVTVPDEWRERYTGKVYSGTPTGNWEVFTTGVESLMTGSGYFTNEKLGFDTEFRDWMLGVLGTLG